VAKNPRKRIPEFIEPFRVEPESKVTLLKDFDPAFKAGVDAAGKDGTIRHVMSGVNPTAVFSSGSASDGRQVISLTCALRRHRAGVPAAIRLGLSNGHLEGLNSRVRLIRHRSVGSHSAAPLIALIYLCCGGITIDLPLR
jgi:hypothetical protein